MEPHAQATAVDSINKSDSQDSSETKTTTAEKMGQNDEKADDQQEELVKRPAANDAEEHDTVHDGVGATGVQDIFSDNEDDDEDEDDELSDDGDESDIEDNVDFCHDYININRKENPELPDTVSVLDTGWGSKVYLVGTAHFSLESQADVAKTIQETQPDVVMVELCKSRTHTLHLDEATLLEEAKNITIEKIRRIIKESGFVQGITYWLMLNMSAHVTKQLGMAPGGEFRRAYQEAQKIPYCRLQLGDRPIQITVKRVLASLSVWQKMKFAWNLICARDPINKDDVEKFKNKDLLEEMLREMAGEFPSLTKVVVNERDIFLANSLKLASRSVKCPVTADTPNGLLPRVIVGVVGIGHVPGIVQNWEKEDYDIEEILRVPEPSKTGTFFRWIFRASLLGAVGLGCYRLYTWTAPLLS